MQIGTSNISGEVRYLDSGFKHPFLTQEVDLRLMLILALNNRVEQTKW